MLFVGAKVLRVVTGSRDQLGEPYYRDVRMPAAGAVISGARSERWHSDQRTRV